MRMISNSESLKRARARAVEQGKCMECRNRKAKLGCVTCANCLTKRRERAEARRAIGLCLCGRKPRPNRKSCVMCSDQQAGYVKIRRQEATMLGMCVKCFAVKAQENRKHCTACLAVITAKQKVRVKKRNARGLCAHCSRPLASKSLCQMHLEKVRAYNQRKAMAA